MSRFERLSPWVYGPEQRDDSLFYASEEVLRKPALPHPDMESCLARIDAKLGKPIPTQDIIWALDEPLRRKA